MEEILILRKLKKGGQKDVYLIEHPEIGICVKKIGKCMHKASLDRIKREVSLLKDIDSPYFPKILDANFDEDGSFMILEEYIESKSLNDIMPNYRANENEVVRLALKIIEGLKILWDMKVVHRDLKPDNILIKFNGEPVIIDLGIARILDEQSLTLTIQQNGPCTLIYAAPEQIKNNKLSINHRADFYSLGVIIAELILGKHPFSPEVTNVGLGIVDNVLNGIYGLEYDGIRLSDRLNYIIVTLLNPEPYRRFKTYQMFEEELKKVLEG